MAQRINKKVILSNWLPGSGTPTNFTQALQQQIQNARAVHFLSFVMPQYITPFNSTDGFFSFYQDGDTTILKSVDIDESLYFITIQGFVDYMNALFLASADARINQLSFSLNPTDPGVTGYSNYRLILSDSGGTVSPLGYDGIATSASYGNYLIGFAQESYGFAASFVADGFPNVILRTNQIRIQMNLTSSTYSANRDYNTVFAVPCNVNPGNLLSFYSPYRIEFPAVMDNIATVTVKLVDDNGIELNLPSNVYASITLAIECDDI